MPQRSQPRLRSTVAAAAFASAHRHCFLPVSQRRGSRPVRQASAARLQAVNAGAAAAGRQQLSGFCWLADFTPALAPRRRRRKLFSPAALIGFFTLTFRLAEPPTLAVCPERCLLILRCLYDGAAPNHVCWSALAPRAMLRTPPAADAPLCGAFVCRAVSFCPPLYYVFHGAMVLFFARLAASDLRDFAHPRRATHSESALCATRHFMISPRVVRRCSCRNASATRYQQRCDTPLSSAVRYARPPPEAQFFLLMFILCQLLQSLSARHMPAPFLPRHCIFGPPAAMPSDFARQPGFARHARIDMPVCHLFREPLFLFSG